jgi:hypothetical protein
VPTGQRECVAHRLLLRSGAEVRGRLVEQQEWHVAQKGPRQGNALRMSPAEAGTAHAGRDVVALRQHRDELVRLCQEASSAGVSRQSQKQLEAAHRPHKSCVSGYGLPRWVATSATQQAIYDECQGCRDRSRSVTIVCVTPA